MPLREERALQQFRLYAFPRWESEIRESVNFDITIDVDWESLSQVGMAHRLTHNLINVFFHPLVAALQQIAFDDVGCKALVERLREIRIGNSTDNSDAESWASFSEGVLTLDHAPNVNVQDVNLRIQSVLHELETKL